MLEEDLPQEEGHLEGKKVRLNGGEEDIELGDPDLLHAGVVQGQVNIPHAPRLNTRHQSYDILPFPWISLIDRVHQR